MKITIDIILFCYKQEQYIRHAVESILMQEMPKDAEVRIVVADDHSPDRTLEIIKEARNEKRDGANRFEWVFLPEEPNMGISKNYKRSFAATTAEYVFILEGDDYWLPGHIMQHIDFLQQHKDYSMCMNSLTTLYEDTGFLEGPWWITPDYFKTVDLKQQIEEGNSLGNLSACSFMGRYLRELPNKIFTIPIADWMLGVMMAQRGPIAILKDTTSVYLYKSSGVWAGRSYAQQQWVQLRYSKMYDDVQEGAYHDMWRSFQHKIIHETCVHWTKLLPISWQSFIHRVKRKWKIKK